MTKHSSIDPLVSIGLPVYNCEATVLDAIRSVFAQSYTNWELLIVDDGSTDGSMALCESINDPRISVHRDAVNRGLAARLNQITSLANGEFIARMDADDLMHPERIRRQVDVLISRPDIDIVGSGLFTIDSKSHVWGKRLPEDPANAGDHPIARAAFVHPSVLGRAIWFKQNPYDESFLRAEDLELWARTRHRRVSVNLLEPLLFYRELPGASGAKYRRSAPFERKVLWRHGRNSLIATAPLLAQSYAKQIAYLGADRIGQTHQLVRGRNSRLEESERADAQAIVDRIRSLDLAGPEVR